MKALLDTHLLLWAASEPKRILKAARALTEDPENGFFFSAASLWEFALKRGLRRQDFRVDPGVVRRALLDNGYGELPITSEHVIQIEQLPPKHKDPFDRVLVAQAILRESRYSPTIRNWPVTPAPSAKYDAGDVSRGRNPGIGTTQTGFGRSCASRAIGTIVRR